MPITASKTTLAAPLYVAGYETRTSMAKEAAGDSQIGQLWTNFYMQHQAGAEIPHRVGDSLIAVYSNYASDEKGEYTYLLGAPVDSIEGLPKDLTYRKIPAGTYAVVTSATGSLQEVVPAAWKQVWAMSPAQLGGKRSFVMDYEVVTQSPGDPSSGSVEIHLGLAPETPAK